MEEEISFHGVGEQKKGGRFRRAAAEALQHGVTNYYTIVCWVVG
jgi:hypothetical protein